MTRLGSICGLLLLPALIQAPVFLLAQDGPPPDQQQQQAPPAQPLPPEQLDSLVAPIALYPDSLLSQVLVASTYPLELVEADRWLQQNGGLQGSALVDAAKQQNWDPSVQALVVFPDVIKRLDSDIRWTTDLGNAFLSQQADVMDAVQRMRARARDSGKLVDTPQERIQVQNENGQSAIEIEPTDPQVIYVPTYNPDYFWGPSPYYPWPGLYYPAVGFGWGWGGGIHVGLFFGGCCGWGGWGWGPGWFNHTVVVNNYFFHRYNYRDFHGDGAFRGNSVWAHDSFHRQGVPYPNRPVADRYNGGANNFRGGNTAQRFNGGPETNAGRSSFATPSRSSNFSRPDAPRPQQPDAPRPQQPEAARPRQPEAARPQQNFNGGQSFNSRQFEERNNNHSAFGGVDNGGRARFQSDHGFSSMGPQRTAPAFRGGGGGAPAPRSAPAAAPRGGGGRRR